MQYVLSESEYCDLLKVKDAKAAKNKDALQKACTLAAKHAPITVSWATDQPPTPWGCVLDEESNPGYCDCCPVQDACPNEFKEWSK